MAWTQQNIDDLKAAMADGRGARTMTFGDQTVTFHTIAEQLELLAAMQADVVAQQAAAGINARTRYAAFSKGA